MRRVGFGIQSNKIDCSVSPSNSTNAPTVSSLVKPDFTVSTEASKAS